MVRPDQYFDWNAVAADDARAAPVGTRQRLRLALALYAVLAAVVFGRAVQLEIVDGQAFRDEAARPSRRTISLSAPRGRILARDGTVLAEDRALAALAVHYRYLENPADRDWVRQTARLRLPCGERRNRDRLREAEAAVRREHAALQDRLAELCGLSPGDWRDRTEQIQRRVATLEARVNRQRVDRHDRQLAEQRDASESDRLTWRVVLTGLFTPPESLAPTPVILKEQTDYHVVVEDVPQRVVGAIKDDPAQYPGVRIVEVTRRCYPAGSLAAHVVGQVGSPTPKDLDAQQGSSPGLQPEDRIGRMGVERQFDGALRGARGAEIHWTDRGGNLLSRLLERPTAPGRDVTLTIDPELQRTAELLLDRARRPREPDSDAAVGRGGAIVVLDVESGELVAAASAPRFDANLFREGNSATVRRLLADSEGALFDRVTKMALPPGSVFKTVTAIAALEQRVVAPHDVLTCQGYLHEPDSLRCAIFRQYGVGHGDVVLADALAQSCNVYFFHYGGEVGLPALVDWARRCGFGRPTGVDLPDEAAGHVPEAVAPNDRRERSASLAEARAMAVGQGELTVTPLQVARLMAAVANGGRLVTPRITRDRVSASRGDSASAANSTSPAGEDIPQLKSSTLDAVREGLRRVVADSNGTAYATVRLPSLSVAGKTGTAEAGGRRPDHAWFAGYAPADAPRYAFVVVLEHAGGAGNTAGPVARRLLQRMQQLGYFGAPATVEVTAVPDGKG